MRFPPNLVKPNQTGAHGTSGPTGRPFHYRAVSGELSLHFVHPSRGAFHCCVRAHSGRQCSSVGRAGRRASSGSRLWPGACLQNPVPAGPPQLVLCLGRTDCCGAEVLPEPAHLPYGRGYCASTVISHSRMSGRQHRPAVLRCA